MHRRSVTAHSKLHTLKDSYLQIMKLANRIGSLVLPPFFDIWFGFKGKRTGCWGHAAKGVVAFNVHGSGMRGRKRPDQHFPGPSAYQKLNLAQCKPACRKELHLEIHQAYSNYVDLRLEPYLKFSSGPHLGYPSNKQASQSQPEVYIVPKSHEPQSSVYHQSSIFNALDFESSP